MGACARGQGEGGECLGSVLGRGGAPCVVGGGMRASQIVVLVVVVVVVVVVVDVVVVLFFPLLLAALRTVFCFLFDCVSCQYVVSGVVVRAVGLGSGPSPVHGK